MKFITGAGKEFNYKWVGTAFTGNLVIAIENSNVSDVVAMGMNKEDTKNLVFYPDDNRPEISIMQSGFTRFSGVLIDESSNTINLTLGKEFA